MARRNVVEAITIDKDILQHVIWFLGDNYQQFVEYSRQYNVDADEVFRNLEDFLHMSTTYNRR